MTGPDTGITDGQTGAGPPRAPRPPGLRLSSTEGRWVLAVTVMGTGMAFLEATVVNVALPEISRDLGAGLTGIQWTISGYLLALASLILLGGSLGDRYGRRRIFNLGIVWFTAASLLSAIAPSVPFLVAARVLQGIGGALLTPGSLAIIEASFAPEDKAGAIGAWSALTGVFAAVGPLVGGYLIDAVSWRAIFLINLPIGAFLVAMAIRRIPESRSPTPAGRLDVPGAALAALGLAGITYALISVPAEGLGRGFGTWAAVGGMAMFAAFILVERRTRTPMMPLDIFASRQFTSANLVTFVVYAALGSVFFLLVAFLQVSMGYSALAAGAASLPVTLIMLLFSSPAGRLAQRIGPRLPLTVGPLVLGLGMLLMSRIDIGDAYVAAILPSVAVFGLGLSLTVAPVTATVLAAADPRYAGVASAVNNAVARVAGLLAVAVLPPLAGLTGSDFLQPAAMAEGFARATVLAAAAAITGGVVAFATISADVLHTVPAGEPAGSPERAATDVACPVAGPPLRPGREARCRPLAEARASESAGD
jgi:EmrB/QacA subfamily drug resistance transporter